jgi:hypothetical protein
MPQASVVGFVIRRTEAVLPHQNPAEILVALFQSHFPQAAARNRIGEACNAWHKVMLDVFPAGGFAIVQKAHHFRVLVQLVPQRRVTAVHQAKAQAWGFGNLQGFCFAHAVMLTASS